MPLSWPRRRSPRRWWLRSSRAGGPGSPERAVIDSREARATLFVGLTGGSSDGGAYAAAALRPAPGASMVRAQAGRRPRPRPATAGCSPRPTRCRAAAAGAAWRRELGARVVGITGSVGKTGQGHRGGAPAGPRPPSPQNYNTEIGLPLDGAGRPARTDVLVLEMAMRGPGQIAELAEIGEPDVARSPTSARSTSSCWGRWRRSPQSRRRSWPGCRPAAPPSSRRTPARSSRTWRGCRGVIRVRRGRRRQGPRVAADGRADRGAGSARPRARPSSTSPSPGTQPDQRARRDRRRRRARVRAR